MNAVLQVAENLHIPLYSGNGFKWDVVHSKIASKIDFVINLPTYLFSLQFAAKQFLWQFYSISKSNHCFFFFLFFFFSCKKTFPPWEIAISKPIKSITFLHQSVQFRNVKTLNTASILIARKKHDNNWGRLSQCLVISDMVALTITEIIELSNKICEPKV